MTCDRYILVDGQPVEEPDIVKWGRWFEDGDKRRLLLTEVGDYRVSTVFLGIDHGFGRGDRPALWETMVFRDKPRATHRDGDAVVVEADYSDRMVRYTSEEDARRGHAAMVAAIEAGKFEEVPDWQEPEEAA